VGFGKAAEIAKKEMQTSSFRLENLRERLIEGLLKPIPYSFFERPPNKETARQRLCRYDFIEGESMLLSLDIEGVFTSSGSACTQRLWNRPMFSWHWDSNMKKPTAR